MSSTNLTPRLQSGVDIINIIDPQKFVLVLKRVAQCIQNKPDDLKPFSEEEEEKLSSTLSIGLPELRLMLDCSTFILKQAAFNLTKPAVLEQQLSEQYRLNEDKVEAFVVTWTNQAKSIVAALKHKSTYPKQVEGVGWLLNTAVSSSDCGPMMEPRALIQLKLHHDDGGAGHLNLDLNQPQLQALYQTLEDIQARLDNLR